MLSLSRRIQILIPFPLFSHHSNSILHLSFSSSFSRDSSIHLLNTCKWMPHLKQIQALLYTNGLHHDTHLLHKLMAFASTADLHHAHKLFSTIPRPTLFIFNVFIKALVKSSHWNTALNLFDQLCLTGLRPDNYTYPFVFKAVSGLGFIHHGQRIHGFAFKTGILHDSYVSNSVLDMYGGLGKVQSLRKAFDEMPFRDSISWNLLISGFVKSSQFEEAIGVYKRMVKEGNVQPDEATVVSTLSACTALRGLDLGREIHDYVVAWLGFTVRIENALLDMYAKGGCLDIARQIFDAMVEKNVICWTSMVSAYVNCGHLDEAKALFERSPVRDLILWTTMINGYVQFNRVDEAMVLFRQMQMNGVKPDNYTLVALLTGCAQLGALEQGQWIHAYLQENRIPIDMVVGTALIEMYAKCGYLEKSLQIFYQLKDKDTASWTSMICSLAMNDDTCKALELFSEMIKAGVRPDDVTFIGVLTACSHGGLVDEGRRHFDSMTRVFNIEPKLEHYGCLVDLLGRAGMLEEAEGMISEVSDKESKTVVPLYGALLSACRNYDNVEVGERIAKRIVEFESGDSCCGHTLLASIYAAASRWDDARRVRKKMLTRGWKKLPGCSVVEVGWNVS